MKKLFLLIAALSFILLTSASLFATPKSSVPQKIYKFESVPEGTIIKHKFIIKNIGDEPLIIKNIQTS